MSRSVKPAAQPRALSPRALQLLAHMFGPSSGGVQVPMSVAREVVEIQEWIAAQRTPKPAAPAAEPVTTKDEAE